MSTDDDVVMTDSIPQAFLGPTPEDKVSATVAKEEGNALFQSKLLGRAVDSYTKAIELDPTESSYLTNRAAAYMGLKMYKPALEDCRFAKDLQVRQDGTAQPKTLARLARCLLYLGDPKAAVSVLSGVDEVAAKQLRDQAQKVLEHLASFDKFKSSKGWTLASIALDQAQQACGLSDADVPMSWRMLKATVLLHKGQLDQANSVISDALRSDPSNPEALLVRARILLAKGETTKSIAHCQAALRSDPELKDSRDLLRKVRKLETKKEQGNTAFKASENEDAVRLYSEALEMTKEEEDRDGQAKGFRATLFSNRGTANSKLGKHEQTVQDCTSALEMDSGYVKALKTRARAYLSLERYEEAVRDFTKALEASRDESLERELRSAEIDLKRSKKKDHYKTLGVSKSANEAEIKKAYRKESLKHHPDKGGDEEKFKLCSEAYNILSDDNKRRRYDAGADDPESEYGASMGGVQVNLADLFGGGGMGGFPGGSRRGGARPPPGFSFG